VDTPGYADFVGEVKAGLRVCEGAVISICAAAGVEVGTEQAWEYILEGGLSRLIFINKMDRENADFYRAVEQIQSKFGSKCVPMQLPIGAQDSFEGFVDLITMTSYTGSSAKEGEIPEALRAQADSFREKLIEAAAEIDDKLIEKYLGGEELTLDEIKSSLRQGVVAGTIVPILVGSALQSIGIASLIDAMVGYLPSPEERDVVLISGSDEEKVKPAEEGAVAALVFKTSADPYVGKLLPISGFTPVL